MGFVPHAGMIVALSLAQGTVAMLAWFELRKCTCHERGSFLRPKWKRYGKKK